MFDYEINRYIEERNYNLSSTEYLYICDTCPQINHIKYDSGTDRLEMWSVDGGYWNIKVYKE